MARQTVKIELPKLIKSDVDSHLVGKDKPLATLTIKSAASMSQTEANEMALWLRKLATEIKSKERLNYSKRFTARFL